ncbi:MAG: DUF2807 domain-containing protein [Hyphomonadaceae bacterium]
MNKLLYAAAAAITTAAPAAFAETRDHAGFTAVEAAGNVEVQVIQGARFSVVVDDARADRVLTRVYGDTLEIDMRNNWSLFGGGHPPGRVTVTLPTITGLGAAAGSTVRAENIRADAISLDSSSGADLYVSGACARLTADVSSGADLHARELRCADGSVDASSGSDASVFLTGSVDVDGSSGADVRLYGGASIRNLDLSSGADVHQNR